MWILKLVVIVMLVEKGVLISTKKKENDSLELLWNLTNLAIQQSNLQGRQKGYTNYLQVSQTHLGQKELFERYPEAQKLQESYPPLKTPPHRYLELVAPPGYPPQQYLSQQNQFQGHPFASGLSGSYPQQYPSYPRPPYLPGYSYPSKRPPTVPFFHGGSASIMDVLHSVAQNDELHCVPKLLCELTSSARSDNRQSSLLPFNINMDLLLGLLSQFGPNSNPLFLFGKAALLGYTSQGSGSSCYTAFSSCPNDPDELVNYLNNYNGGFFRYFNGYPRPYRYEKYQTPQNYGFVSNGGHPNASPGYNTAQEKILTTGNNLITNKYPHRSPTNFYDSNHLSKGIKFPVGDFLVNSIVDDHVHTKYKSGKSSTFPGDISGHHVVRNGKTLSFPDAHYHPGLDFQMVHPSHIASPFIFPTRTGTGELLLDTEELN